MRDIYKLSYQNMKDFRKNTLVDFSVLFDTDIGCCLYLYKYAKKDFFESYIYTATYEYIQYMVLCRKERNPIRFMFKNEYKKNADIIYNELLEKKWNKVLNISPPTDILKIIMGLHLADIANITVNCRNEEEVKKLNRSIEEHWKTVVNEENFDDYFVLYVHDMEDILKRDLKEKVVNLYGYARNYVNKDMRNQAISEYCILFANTTKFTLISPFSNFVLPEG